MYDVKPDLAQNLRLVYDENIIDPCGPLICATVVNEVPLRLLNTITDSQNLKLLTDDIGNCFIQAHTNERI